MSNLSIMSKNCFYCYVCAYPN